MHSLLWLLIADFLGCVLLVLLLTALTEPKSGGDKPRGTARRV